MEAPTQVFDALDLDLVVKVLANTLFSPFFTFWVPLFYKAQGAAWSSPIVTYSAAYFLLVSSYWILLHLSSVWRNDRSLLWKPERIDWGEQIIVITGGSSGIGELLANTFAVRNVTVCVLDVNEIESENYNINHYKCDVSKWEEVEKVAKKIQEDIGHPTVLINNAGVVQGKLLLDLTPEDVQQTLNTNLAAHFWTLKAFLPNMIKENAGHIITIGSVMGLVASAQMTDYCATKAGLASLHESLRYELDKRYHARKVRTTLVVPGHVNTPLFSRVSFPGSFLWRFLFPSVAPHSIAKAAIAAVDEQESRTINMPFYVNFAWWAGALPTWARDFVQWLSTADYAMRDFVKVSGRRPDEGPAPEPSNGHEHDEND
ncbi:retinal short-chain dehydrogenase/reductase [Exidia glandulosa HHB12029]|uniref:Short-chain dehydrogenase/reductase 3 n=1 Tax=Exidia glandulosa HHB12029 TaxID=1314781 RepID=A0A165R0U0_EXIGL|nr:retinal short-chain dehydrogenase/reductase [Exidia glandulosa HHB12029]